jgi:hypothetical protein
MYLLSRRESVTIQSICYATVKRKERNSPFTVDCPTIVIAAVSFLLIAFLKRDVALAAAGAMLGGITYSSIRTFA